MQDARYLRAQAEFCLKLASQLSSREAAENLRAAAAQYFARACAVEEGYGDGSADAIKT